MQLRTTIGASPYRLKAEYDRAIEDFDEAIRLLPSFANAFNNRAIAYRNKGDLDHALADSPLRAAEESSRSSLRGDSCSSDGGLDEEIRPYLDHLERMAAIRDEQVPKDDDDDFLRDSAEQLAAKRERLAELKELLTSTMLGTA